METEITPMLLRPASDTVVAQSRLWGDETVGDKTDRAEVFSPLTFSSLSYSHVVGRISGLFVIQFGSQIINSGKMVFKLRKTEICGLF